MKTPPHPDRRQPLREIPDELRRELDARDLADYFIAKGRATARFDPLSPVATGHDCSTCERKTYSFPDRCEEGWVRIRFEELGPCRNHVVTTRG